MRVTLVALLAGLVVARLAGAAAPVELIARTLDQDGVRVAFPAVVYRPPAESGGPVVARCATIASTTLGTAVDPTADLISETEHRVVLRDPTDPSRLLKLYRLDTYTPFQIARLMQHDLGLETYLAGLGLRVAAIDHDPRLIGAGILRAQRIRGRSLADVYPYGYKTGTNPAVDRVLARIAPLDPALRMIVSRQSGFFFTNTVDCYNERPLGIDLGHCYGNIFLEDSTGDPIFVDW